MGVNWQDIDVVLNPFRASFSVGVRTYERDAQWFQRTLTDFDLWYCTAGQGELHLPDGSIHPLKRGSGFLFRPRMKCALVQQAPLPLLQMYYFHFDLKGKASGESLSASAIDDLPFYVEPEDHLFFETVCEKVIARLQLYRRMPYGDTGGAAELVLQQARQLFQTLITELELENGRLQGTTLSHDKPKHYAIIMDLVARIFAHPEKFSSVEKIAHDHSYSVDHFTRIFKAVTGRTVQQVVIDARIQKARQLLHNPSMGTAEIAVALGYESVGFFYRQFRQQTGLTPTQFRKRFS